MPASIALDISFALTHRIVQSIISFFFTHMKPLHYFVLAFTIISGTVNAQESRREMTIRHIEANAFAQSNVYSADSPFIGMLLDSAKSANPGVSPDAWEKMKPDLANALTKSMSEGGGPMAGVLTEGGALDGFSDSEIERVNQFLEDPAYKKFQAALASPAVQQRVMQASGRNIMRMGEALNAVLSRNGLKEVH